MLKQVASVCPSCHSKLNYYFKIPRKCSACGCKIKISRFSQVKLTIGFMVFFVFCKIASDWSVENYSVEDGRVKVLLAMLIGLSFLLWAYYYWAAKLTVKIEVDN